MPESIKIGLVEDQFLFREGMKAILSSYEEFEVVFESEDGFSVMDKLSSSEVIPDVLLVDLSLPKNGDEDFDGIAVTDTIVENYPEIKILILSATLATASINSIKIIFKHLSESNSSR